MAWRAYNTVNGQILGETSASGARPLDYQLDALGSVLGTIKTNGTLENTYRYAGYGQQVSKTGIAPDPKFLWVGGWGYRGRYVRVRSLDFSLGIWLSCDPLWPEEPPFTYAQQNPTTQLDLTGLSPGIVPIKPPERYPDEEDNLPSDCLPASGRSCDFDQTIACRGTCEFNTGNPKAKCYQRQVGRYVCVCCRCNPCEDIPWERTTPDSALRDCVKPGEKPGKGSFRWATECWGRHWTHRVGSDVITVLCCYCNDAKTGKVKQRCKCSRKKKN